MKTSMKKLAAVVLGAGFMLGAAPAFAGDWRLDRSACADTREDGRDARESRRDERYDYSRGDVREDRADRRESSRDRAVTVCPRSAFYYAPDRYEQRRADFRAPRLTLRYDGGRRLHYRTHGGVRIYVQA